MSANLDHIDLNSEALPVEPETDDNGFNVSEPSAGVGVSVVGNLAELGYDKSRDSHAVDDEEVRREAAADELGGGGLEGKIESLVRGFDMEDEAGTLDEGSDAKKGRVNGDVEPGIDGEVEEGVVGKSKSLVRGFDMEAEIGSVDMEFVEVRDAAVDREPELYGEVDGIDGVVEKEEARIVDSCQLEGVLTGGACAAVYSSSIGDSIKVQDAHVLEYSPDNVGMELHVTNTSEVVASGGLQKQEMEIDKQATVVDDQLMSLNAPEPMVSQNDRDDFNPFNLIVDLNSCNSADGNGPDESNVQFASSKVKFQLYDLVWGKVRSHPWWPGQIFNPSAASKKAKKYFKNDSYLIAFFGDQTFTWNDVSKIKTFRSHFPQMEKQSNMESFLCAIDCALDEVARRVESGLACPCLSEESRRDGGDSLPSVASLEPVKLLEHIRAMALSPFAKFDRLEFVIAQAQVSAFYRLKGYCQLPEFTMLGRLWESDVETSLSGEVKYDSEGVETVASKFKEDEQLPGMDESSRPKAVSSKRKHTSEDSMHTTKKRKNLSDLMAEKQMHMSHGERGSEINSGNKVSSSKSGRKRKSVDFTSDHLEVKRVPSYLSKVNDNKSPQPIETFRVGKSILRVASQLNGLTPILKSDDGTSRKTVMKKKSAEKVLSGKSERLILIKDCSPEEMLSQLHLAAQDPMNGYRFLTSGISFFVEFCNSVSPECINPENDNQLELEMCGNDTDKETKNSGIFETSELAGIKDSYWPVRIVQSMSEEPLPPENQTEVGDLLPKTSSENCGSAIALRATVQSSPDLDSKQCTGGETHDLGSSGPLDCVENSDGEDLSPTALILNFTDIDSVPSGANLNNIFSQYGPLRESETQVLRKSSRAKVVFKRRADAETAFSSAGKYSIFGPSLVSYRLKYMHSTASKASGSIKRQSRKGSIGVEENED